MEKIRHECPDTKKPVSVDHRDYLQGVRIFDVKEQQTPYQTEKLSLDRQALQTIRNNIRDAVPLLNALGLPIVKKDKSHYWIKSPFRVERTASLHIEKTGKLQWCDFGQNRNGGGPLELIQQVLGVDIYEAGRWAVEQGLTEAPLNSIKPMMAPIEDKQEEVTPNRPIRQNLISYLSELGTHPEFIERQISAKTCEYLGCGFLEYGKLRNKNNQLQERIVFQVRGVEADPETKQLKPVVLSHVGEAISEQQRQMNGKFTSYKGFGKSQELYNIDHLLLDERSRNQIKETGKILVIEGFFGTAKLVEAGIYNVVATMGANLSSFQIEKLKFSKEALRNHFQFNQEPQILIWYDRDLAGTTAQAKAVAELKNKGHPVTDFDWWQEFHSEARSRITIPLSIEDPCDFSVPQLQWLREQNII